MTCEEVRAWMAEIDAGRILLEDQTPSTLIAARRHVQGCKACYERMMGEAMGLIKSPEELMSAIVETARALYDLEKKASEDPELKDQR